IVINAGNRQLKHRPRKYYGYLESQKNLMRDNLVWGLYTNSTPHTTLLFCKYREEVATWVDFFNALDIGALGCVGGEASLFQQRLEQNPNVRVIVATSVLSHGVNLPQIGAVFITYPLKNRDFWIQMV